MTVWPCRKAAVAFLWQCIGLALACLAPALAAAAGLSAPSANAGGQAAPTFESIGVGVIPREVVPSIAQDRTGYLWVATGDGLWRYDGYRFRPQERESADPAKRSLGWIQAMLPARDGRLWIGTEVDGLVAYDPRTDQLVDHRLPTAATGPLPTVTALAEADDGSVWVGTLGGGLLRFDASHAKFFNHGRSQQLPGLADDRISALAIDRSGALWIGTWNGSFRVRRGSDRPERVALGSASETVARIARAFLQASDGRIWVGTSDGAVLRIDPDNLQAEELAGPAKRAEPAPVTSLAEAPGGRVWVGRTSGLDVHDLVTGQLRREVRHDPRQHRGLAAPHVTSLLTDRTGSIWVAGLGLGLQRHDPNGAIQFLGADLGPRGQPRTLDARALAPLRGGEVWASVHQAGIVKMDAQLRTRGVLGPPPPGSSGASGSSGAGGATGATGASAMMQAGDMSVWVGREGSIEQLSPSGQRLRHWSHGAGATHHIAEGTDLSMWIGTDDGLYRIRPGSNAPVRVHQADGRPLAGPVWMTTVAPDSAVWVASTAGLYRVAPAEDVLHPVEQEEGAGLANPNVLALLFDRHGTLWLDTAVAGLHRMSAWDGRRARFDRVSARHGVFGRPFGVNLMEDGLGRIWTHMYVYDPRSDGLHELTATDGIVFGTGWFRSSAKLADGRMLFGGAKGILLVEPDRFVVPGHAPPLAVTEIRIGGARAHAAALERGLDLLPGQRGFSVEFAALDLARAGRIRYAYRLEPFEPGWIQTGSEARMASYSNLDPGTYTLRVRSANADGVWSPNELALEVRVLPSWWEQPGFKAALIVLSGLAIMGLVWWRTARLRNQRNALQDAVQARTGELQALLHNLEQRVEERTRELQTAMQVAESANQAKTSFLLSMSHEMRTPLNAILGLTRLQRRDAGDDSARSHLGRVDTAARYLLGIINEVLDLAKIEAGTAELIEGPFELVSVFEGLQDMLEPIASGKNVVLSFDIDPGLQRLPRLFGDRQRIMGILLNFVGNALKFTEVGHVRVSAVVLEEQDDAVALRFDVEDTGPGIDDLTQTRLFNIFVQADDPMTRRHRGAGLGLAINRRWAEMMQGTVGVSSSVGKGSRFWFAVTLRKADPAMHGCDPDQDRAVEDLPAAFHGQRVLLVEDDEVNRIVASALLESQGLVVDTAGDGAEAVRKSNSGRYALILMDVQMPEVNGLEATRLIRRAGADPQVPIVGLTAFTLAEDRQRCLDAGMNDHLGKPLVPAHLVTAIRRWMRLQPVPPALPDPPR